MNSLYRKLAVTNMKNNKQFYLPYLLTGMISVMMFYSMLAIQKNDGISSMRGAENLKTILGMGTGVIGFFVCILLFYTNSFIIKRRKKELGVYNILGMEKKHIARVLFWETLFTFVLSIGSGLIFGIVFNKLLTMILYWITGLSESIPFYISGAGCIQTVELFGVIYLATLLYNFMQVKLANPVELLRGGNTGEREPKTKIFLTIVGVLCIGVAYYIAITTENIMRVLTLFLVAVILVIIGTYALFTAGSIAFLKILRSNKKYYYKTKHFTAVSGMLYRMKQNAVGLANICILSTMVLVMISTTVSMYVGLGDELDARYAGEIDIAVLYNQVPDEEMKHAVLDEIKNCMKESGREVTVVKDVASLTTVMKQEEDRIEILEKDDPYLMTQMGMLGVTTRANYIASEKGELKNLKENEVAILSSFDYKLDHVILLGKEYQVVENQLLSDSQSGIGSMLPGGIIYLVVSDDAVMADIYEKIKETTDLSYEISINTDGTPEEKKECLAALREHMSVFDESNVPELVSIAGYSIQSKQEGYEDFLRCNGGFLFLGLFLGSMFLMVTVLIIYYKQISEGYEDKERFAIMQKVGMSNNEVKAAIGSQIRTVFFLPLVTAAIHLSAAFPMLKRLLAMMNLYNGTLFAKCLCVTLLIFGVIYFIVFKVTSKTYYKIVGEQY